MFVWRILFLPGKRFRAAFWTVRFFCRVGEENGSEASLSFDWDSPMDRECKLGGPESGLIRKSRAHLKGAEKKTTKPRYEWFGLFCSRLV